MLLITDPAVDFCVLVFSKSFSSMCAMVQLSQLTAIPPSLMLMRGWDIGHHWDYAVSVRYSGARSKTMIRLLYEK
jgi:hypothetical protein